MHAVTIVDGDLRWQEHPDPVPRTDEVAVTVAAAGINAADLLQRAGHYPPPPGWPVDVPGMEFAGRVLRAGPGAGRFAPGDRVMALCGGGGQAEIVVVPETCLLPVPEGVDDAAAGGFPEAFSTAQDALFSQAGLTAGERVVISGAAGGVGTAAVQLARAAGAEVVATVRDPSLHERVAALGAHTVVLPEEVAEHGPYDVSLELVGAPGITAVLPALATGARVVVIGVGGGTRLELDLLAMMGLRGDHPRFDPALPVRRREGRGGRGGRGECARPVGRRRGRRAGGRDLPDGRGDRRLRAVRRRWQVREDRPAHRLIVRPEVAPVRSGVETMPWAERTAQASLRRSSASTPSGRIPVSAMTSWVSAASHAEWRFRAAAMPASSADRASSGRPSLASAAPRTRCSRVIWGGTPPSRGPRQRLVGGGEGGDVVPAGGQALGRPGLLLERLRLAADGPELLGCLREELPAPPRTGPCRWPPGPACP